ncbi:aspartate racemase [Micromonospora sediminicola]|uniref:Aspartate racemase n=1 Tax=Micromonospora sediminicola TaxID=946078 RepID=A0A1A9BA84_9ACTN|nr:amino acid racemase [Micromonospora sediminicola]SBT65884.1 aspartate racemase [Micromonospora sediminicola]
MKRIGIVGGVGPYAAAHFYRRILDLCPAVTDEEYAAVILVAEQIPSRIDHQLARGPSPLPALEEAVRRLCVAGADLIAIPSATTHVYRADLLRESRVPIVDLLLEVAAHLERADLCRPLILATEATVALRSFEPLFSSATRAIYPDPHGQRQITDFIYRVKRGEPSDRTRAEFTQCVRALLRAHPDADCVVLGCTELSVIAPAVEVAVPIVDATDVLAHAALNYRADATSPRTNKDELEVRL